MQPLKSKFSFFNHYFYKRLSYILISLVLEGQYYGRCSVICARQSGVP